MKIFAVLVATLVAFASATSNLRAQKAFEHGEVMGAICSNFASKELCTSPDPAKGGSAAHPEIKGKCAWDATKKCHPKASTAPPAPTST